VNPAYTSQTCHNCGHTDSESRESQARFRCTRCSHECHADVNAATNILSAAGHAVPAGPPLRDHGAARAVGAGDLAAGRSVEQEPAGTREEVPLQPEPVGIPGFSRGEEVKTDLWDLRGNSGRRHTTGEPPVSLWLTNRASWVNRAPFLVCVCRCYSRVIGLICGYLEKLAWRTFFARLTPESAVHSRIRWKTAVVVQESA
jgi:hypothetical protein